MTPEEAARLVLTMQAAWPGFAQDDAANTMWATILMRVTPEVGGRACRLLIGNLKFKPTIADWNEQVRAVVRYSPPGAARAALDEGYDAQQDFGGVPDAPLHPNVGCRVNDEFKAARAARDLRRREMTDDEFIRAEGHDPATHRVSKSGFVLRIPPIRTDERIRK